MEKNFVWREQKDEEAENRKKHLLIAHHISTFLKREYRQPADNNKERTE